MTTEATIKDCPVSGEAGRDVQVNNSHADNNMRVAAAQNGPQGTSLMDNHSKDGGMQIGLNEEDDDVGGPCGWGFLHPFCLQRFQTAKCLLFWLCWGGAIQGMVVNGFINTVISTIERRFDLASTESGLIAASYDIASLLCLLPVSYFGGSGSKSRWLGFGVLILGVGSIVFALPHFITDMYKVSGHLELTCSAFKNSSSLNKCDANLFPTLSNYKYIFIAGQLLHGAGAAPLYTLGVAFLDESVKQKMSSVYVGIYYAMAIVGPAVGYLLGAQFMKIYTDIGRVDINQLGLTEYSSAWIGAWWIPFILSGLIAFIVAIPLLAFPKELPGSKFLKSQKISEVHQRGQSRAANEVGFGTSWRDMPESLKLLMYNPTFMFLNLAGASEGLLVTGFATFTPKFIESQFSVVAGTAALIVGLVTVPAGGGGTFLGGWLIKKLQLKLSEIIRLCLILTALSLVLVLVFLANCHDIPFAGLNILYNDSNIVHHEHPNLTSVCNEDCNCSLDMFEAVCGIDKTMYFTACHAGCKHMEIEGDVKNFYNCSCISGSKNASSSVMAYGKRCESTCTLLPAFLVFFFLVILLTFTASMPALTATLRCVNDNQRSFGLGIQWIIVRLLGTIPSPIIFGALIDLTCILWTQACNHEHGSCSVYSNWSLSKYMLLLGVVGKSFSTIFFFFAWILYKPAVEEVNKNGVVMGEDSGYTSTPDVSPGNSPGQGDS